jgi:hypothetical protein
MNANAILIQLGGIGFMCRTGAYNFLNGGDTLTFTLPCGRTVRINTRRDVDVFSSRGELVRSDKAVNNLALHFSRHVLH